MFLLALDTSGPTGSVAVLKEGALLSEITWEAKSSHTSELPDQVQAVLKKAELDFGRVDGIAVTLGPGSFTGLRIGLAFVKGLAQAEKKPVIGVSTLWALARAVSGEGPIVPLLSAKRDEIYGAAFEPAPAGLSLLLEERAASPEAFLEDLKGCIPTLKGPLRFLGSGARYYEKEIRSTFPEAEFLPVSYDAVQARRVGEIGFEGFKAGRFSRGGVDLVPQYLRASEAELKRKK
ncbi:MAG: tRNA (adenosine(37)-N6)-threonylcarbamoyltransferase complex dimerization subunit type 1 TsaB [bacterium]